MLAHLKRSHPQATEVDSKHDVDCVSVPSPPPLTTSHNTDSPRKTTVFQSKLKMAIGTNKKKIDEHLTVMIATDFQPYSIVEDCGFRKFVEALNPNYVLLSRQQIRYDLMPALYAKAKARFLTCLKLLNGICNY